MAVVIADCNVELNSFETFAAFVDEIESLRIEDMIELRVVLSELDSEERTDSARSLLELLVEEALLSVIALFTESGICEGSAADAEALTALASSSLLVEVDEERMAFATLSMFSVEEATSDAAVLVDAERMASVMLLFEEDRTALAISEESLLRDALRTAWAMSWLLRFVVELADLTALAILSVLLVDRSLLSDREAAASVVLLVLELVVDA